MSRAVSVSAVVLAVVLATAGCAGLGSGPGASTPVAVPAANCGGGAGTAGGGPTLSAGVSAIVAHGTCTVVSPGPDSVTVTMALHVPATSPRAALDGTVSTAAGVMAALRGRGITPSDIRDGVLEVQPVLSPVLSSLSGVGGTRVTGYQGSKSIIATVRDPGSAGDVISAVVDAAGNAGQLSVDYSVADPAVRAQARAAAVRQALDKARELADAAGVPLGQLISITDVPQPGPVAAPAPTETIASSGAQPAPDPLPLAAAPPGPDVSVDVVYAVG